MHFAQRKHLSFIRSPLLRRRQSNPSLSVSAQPKMQMNDKTMAQACFARWFKEFDLARVNKSAAKWRMANVERALSTSHSWLIRLCTCNRAYFKVCATRRKSLLAKCIETFHHIRAMTHTHTHAHSLRHIHLKHTRSNYERDDLVAPFSGTSHRRAYSYSAAAFDVGLALERSTAMILLHKEIVYYYYFDDCDSHMLPLHHLRRPANE